MSEARSRHRWVGPPRSELMHMGLKNLIIDPLAVYFLGGAGGRKENTVL